jgi:lipoprotein-releasing system permease protein
LLEEVNSEALLLPITFSQKLLDYKNDITAIYVDVEEGLSNEEVKQSISPVIGGDFEVKTNYEKNELIYKTSKSEKVIVIVILIFIFILSAFNLVASLTMLIIEKMDNIKTLESMGASEKIIFNVFFYEGMLIAGKGILIGLGIGYLVCLLQLFGGLLEMPNSNGELFPVKLKLSDAFLIPFLVLSLSFIASYLPVKYLLKKNYGKDSFEN